MGNPTKAKLENLRLSNIIKEFIGNNFLVDEHCFLSRQDIEVIVLAHLTVKVELLHCCICSLYPKNNIVQNGVKGYKLKKKSLNEVNVPNQVTPNQQAAPTEISKPASLGDILTSEVSKQASLGDVLTSTEISKPASLGDVLTSTEISKPASHGGVDVSSFDLVGNSDQVMIDSMDIYCDSAPAEMPPLLPRFAQAFPFIAPLQPTVTINQQTLPIPTSSNMELVEKKRKYSSSATIIPIVTKSKRRVPPIPIKAINRTYKPHSCVGLRKDKHIQFLLAMYGAHVIVEYSDSKLLARYDDDSLNYYACDVCWVDGPSSRCQACNILSKWTENMVKCYDRNKVVKVSVDDGEVGKYIDKLEKDREKLQKENRQLKRKLHYQETQLRHPLVNLVLKVQDKYPNWNADSWSYLNMEQQLLYMLKEPVNCCWSQQTER